MKDGFAVLHRWARAVALLAFAGGVIAVAVGIWYVNDNYTNRGWGLLGLGIASALFGAATLKVIQTAERAQIPREPVEPKPTLESKEPLPTLGPDGEPIEANDTADASS